MSIATLNSALYRNVKTHTKYDRYFTKTPCKATFLGSYTTTGGMQQMVEWAFKYKNFTKEISKKLKGRNLKETVANIYQFTYDHIQYQADGYDQQLRSPSCTWNVRLEGVDCKSYSLFVSTILTNLNIPHSFRKVKQPSSPSRWSHVYVQIPSGNETLIIDPTLRVNTEVKYIQKEDMEVKLDYYGLHGAEGTEKSEEFINDKDRLGGFSKVLQLFKKKGISESTLTLINEKVKQAYSVNNSFDFDFKLTRKGLIIHRELIQLESSGLNSPIGGGLFESIVGDIEFTKEIGNVLTYGLNSWGASQTPASYPGSDGFKAYLAEIQKLQGGISASNIGQKLTRLDQYFNFLIYQHYYWMNNIGRAYSSRLAMNNAIVTLRKMRGEIVDKTYNLFKNRGVNFIVKTTSTNEMMLWKASLTKFGRGNYEHRQFKATNLSPTAIDLTPKDVHTVDTVNDTTPTIPTTTTTTTSLDNTQSGSNTTTGTPKKNVNQAGIGGGTLAVLALALGGGFLLMNNNKESNTNK
ncbi:hypothetical protein CXF68_12315 [Tenacibaculum sp. Bg11-29]|uniref:transglutaminase-like domain-containing protein n=1 Tax=Tenacibaculum sp. Bg11-29 TaxID=2058306 RepID=UPI000C32BAA6|nr:transglutaminase-like domain-containing protein [Tenacibaculum sp. Bg11-29]PKH51416.1 hypothetical protein CXF68_12315 [Tenacibaculum sp. Bg11-29]